MEADLFQIKGALLQSKMADRFLRYHLPFVTDLHAPSKLERWLFSQNASGPIWLGLFCTGIHAVTVRSLSTGQ